MAKFGTKMTKKGQKMAIFEPFLGPITQTRRTWGGATQARRAWVGLLQAVKRSGGGG
eukprot:NODE_3290_length_950_cov_17.775805_g2736_i0.p3 GENE.NODE_3290_length_950_cov_17.775805_g2736_i0~~NODE_3290_length_950_cov_17.775805_g2736_i0.p3  ORF type:complete len:57 (-),score=2.14 NODE_3290_length_950_cov_17.775805_g2736_i0:664-834(-)